MISDEAVEAAAKVNYSGEFYCAWDDLHSRVQDSWRRRARAALEAAAPYMDYRGVNLEAVRAKLDWKVGDPE